MNFAALLSPVSCLRLRKSWAGREVMHWLLAASVSTRAKAAAKSKASGALWCFSPHAGLGYLMALGNKDVTVTAFEILGCEM